MKTSQHSRLHHALKNDILTGKYKEGDILPSENDLALKHGMARSTVRQSLYLLEKEGYIEKKQGKGSIVKTAHKQLGLLNIKGFSSVAANPSNKFISKPHWTEWPELFFFELTHEQKESGAIYMKRLRLINQAPVILELTYIPNIGLPDFCFQPFINDSLFETLQKRYLIEIKNVEQDITAVKAQNEWIPLLNLKKNDPVLCIRLKFNTNRAELSIFSTLYCNTQQYSVGNIV